MISQKSADLILRDRRKPVFRKQVYGVICCSHTLVDFVSEMASSPLVSDLSISLHHSVKLCSVVMQKIKYLPVVL